LRDPGQEAAKRKLANSGALLKPGDICWIYGGDLHKQRCQITAPYGWHQVAAKDGRYVDAEGEHFNYRLGYRYRCQGIEYFGTAGELVRLDSDAEYSHLRLVHDATRERKT
jgi:hypothetical protein